MPQSLASIVRAQREQQQTAAETPQRAAGNALYVAQGNPRAPAAQAIAEQAGKRLGLPPMLVDDAALAEARVRSNMDALSKAHRTAGWISDPNNAAVASDQVEHLTGIEGFLSNWRGQIARDIETNVMGARRVGAGAYEAIGGSFYGLGLTGERVLDRLGLADGASAAAQSGVPGLAIAGLPSFLKEVGARNRRAAAYLRGEKGSERALSDGVPDLLPRSNLDLGFSGDVAEGLGQIGGQVLTAVGTGGFGSLPSMWGQGVTQMDDRVKADQKKDGRAENSVADDLALAGGGFVTAITEKLGLDAIMGALPAPIRARLTNKLADVAVAGFTEGTSEVLEGVGQNALAMTLLGEDTGLLDGDLAYQGGVGATVGATARALIMTAIPGRQHLSSNQQADRALQEGERFAAVVQTVRQSEMAKRSPERFADFLKTVADPDAEVVIPAEAVATFFQDNPDLDAWMDEWDIRGQVEEARAAGTDMVMSQAAYLAQVAPTAAHDAWAPDIRFGLGEMSQREAEAFRTDGEADLSAALDTAVETAQAQEEAVTPERQVRDALFSQLREAGYTADAANTQATLAARAFARRAERSPERFADAQAAYEAAGLRVEQEFPEVVRQSMDRLDVMVEALKRRSARPSDRRLFGRSMMEFLAQRGGVVDTGGELAAMHVEAWHRPSQGGKAFRRRFVRQDAAGANDFAPDQAARAAVEAGYLPEGATANDLFAAVQAEMSGRPVYSQQFDADLQAGENAAALDELERLMGDLGLDPATSDNATIKAALERAAASDFPGDANYAPDAAYNQDGRLNTDSAAFKAWFGDSKVVDENGAPLVVYHGTNQDFEAFDVAKIGSSATAEGYGFYFAENPDVARGYERDGGSLMRVFLSIQKPIDSKAKAFSRKDTAKLVRAAISEEVGKYPEEIEDYRNGFLSNVVDTYNSSEAVAVREMVDVLMSNDLAVDQIAELANVMGSKELALRAAKSAGLADGIRVADFQQGDGVVWLAFDPTQIKSVNNRGTFDPADPRILYQDTPYTGPRGQIRFSQGKAAITLFGSRDMSTFFHEFGHLTLEMMREDAADPNASDQVKADLQIVLDWFSREAGRTITAADIGVEQHELWARGNEKYLMEGKAPSLELREVFRTVMAWLKNIYGAVLMINAPITDDVRGVMDRLLASDAEIAQARDAAGQALGADAYRQLGATDAEAAAYERQLARARSDAESDLLAQVMRAIRRVRTKEWNEAADEIRAEITAEVDAMPDIAALEFMKTTRTPMDRETAVAMLGDEAGLALLPKRVPPIVAATGGAHPDMIAEAAGYRSGQAMLNGLMEMEAEKRAMVADGDDRSVRKARIENRIREALLDRYGDPMNDGSIEREALDAIHSERYGEVLALDLNLLARRTGNAPAPIDALRAWARDRVGSRPVREARPGRYLRAERTASTAVQRALAAGDRDEAFRQKQAQAINNVLYVEAGRAERFADAAINRMRRLGRGRNPSIHVDYMEQIDAILEQYELKAVSGRTVQRRASLAAFVEAQTAAGEPINIPADVLASLAKTNLADLTVDELRGLDAAVKNLVHLGRMKTDLILNGERRELSRVGDEVLERSAYIRDRRVSETPGAQSWVEERRVDLDSAVASLRKLQEIARRMDGSDTEGPFHDYLDRPSMKAANDKARLASEFWMPIKAAVDAIPKEVKARWMDVLDETPFINPRTGAPLDGMKRADLITAALNVGTMSNFESMAKGWGLISKEADALAVSAARQGFIGWLNQRLDPSEWAYVQAWWDAHERLRPDYFAAARKVEGAEPDPVEPEVVNTPAGPLKGGYAPLIYHPDFDEATLLRQQQDDADPLGGLARAGPRPDNGSTVSRTGYSGPVDLRMDSHRMAADIHLTYAAYAEFVSNALKFINHRPIREAVIVKLGKPIYDTLRPWLESQVRGDRVIDPNAKFWQKVLRQARSNVVMASLLGSATVLLAQGSGLIATLAKVGPVTLSKGAVAAIRLNRIAGGDGAFDFVSGKSDFMRLRLEEGELDRDIRFALAKAETGLKIKADAAALAGKAIAAVDFYLVSGPTWLGVYEREIEAGREEADAVYAADIAVSTTQGGGRARDASGFMRGNDALKMGTIAFGWASAFENMVSGAVFDIRQGQNVGRNVGTLSALLILMPLMDALMSGDLPDAGDDEEETMANYADWFVRNVLTNLLVGIPFARDIGSWAEREWKGDYTGTIGQTPVGRISSEFTRLYKDIKSAVDDEKDVSHRWPSHVISAVGLSFGIPGTSQAARTTSYALDVAEGDQNPETPLDVATGVIRGPQDSQR